MISALLLDLDDTLIDDRSAMARAVLAFRAQHQLSIELDDEQLSQRWDSIGRALWRQLDLGEVGFDEQRRLRLKNTFALDISDEEADRLIADYLHCYEQNWANFSYTQAFLDASAHLPRAIITNGHRPQAHKKLAQLGLDKHFDIIVTPDDCGARKPDPKIFLHTLAQLNVAPENALMIGDNLEADIEPAQALGIRVFHIDHMQIGRTVLDVIQYL